MLRLIAPDARARASFLVAMDELVGEGRATADSLRARFGERWQTGDGFARLVADMLAEDRSAGPPGLVPQTTRWWVEGPHACPEYIGRISVRHRLTDQLRRIGGHIGYDVRPSRRRQGHATAMLAAVLPLAHGLGIDPALITCDATNLASRRVIERNGGIPADASDGILRFWVPTG